MLRRLGEAAVVFDRRTWETHVLPPAATVIAEVVAEATAGGQVSPAQLRERLRDELEIDPEQGPIRELLRMFGEIGLLDE